MRCPTLYKVNEPLAAAGAKGRDPASGPGQLQWLKVIPCIFRNVFPKRGTTEQAFAEYRGTATGIRWPDYARGAGDNADFLGKPGANMSVSIRFLLGTRIAVAAVGVSNRMTHCGNVTGCRGVQGNSQCVVNLKFRSPICPSRFRLLTG